MNRKWIENQLSLVVNEKDKILIEEAVKCYNAKCFRAAYIMCWITLIESLKRKIEEYVILENKKAESVQKQISMAEERNQSADKIIFEGANNCGIIDNNELKDVEYLWKQRCVFTHPYNIVPSDIDVISILEKVIKISLSKALCYNKELLDEIISNIIEKPFFLPIDKESINDYAEEVIKRTPELIQPYLFKALHFKVSEILGNTPKHYELKKILLLIHKLLERSSIPLSDGRWTLEKRATDFPFATFICVIHRDLWKGIPDRISEMLFSYYETESDRKKFIVMANAVSKLRECNILDETYTAIHNSKLDNTSFDIAIRYYGNSESAIKRFISELDTDRYIIQNQVIDFLESSESKRVLNNCHQDDLITLGKQISYIAKNNNWKSRNFISDIKIYEPPEFLQQGVAIGLVINSNDKFYFKKEWAVLCFTILNGLGEDNQNDTYAKLRQIVTDGKIEIHNFKDLTKESAFDKIDKVNDDIEWGNINNAKYLEFVEQLKSKLDNMVEWNSTAEEG